MNTEDAIELNEFEKEWIQGEAEAAAADAESVATIDAARAEEDQAANEYLQAHADLESEAK